MKNAYEFPIKVLLDEDKNVFIPFITTNAVLVNGTDETAADQIANRYTKQEVDNLIAGLGTLQRICGQVNTKEELPTEGVSNGDTYLVGTGKNHDEYMYINGAWEILGPMIDLSVFYTKQEIDALNVTINNSIATAQKNAENYTDSKTGALSNLNTDAKTDLVNAINEVDTNTQSFQDQLDSYNTTIIARLQTLTTLDETSIVNKLASLVGSDNE